MHRREYFCNACHETSSSRAEFQAHLLEKHSNLIDPTELQVIIDRCERPIQSEQCCPLCPDKHAAERLRRHLGGHLQQIALFVPRPDEDEGADEGASVGAEAGESEDDHGSGNGSKLYFESDPSRTSGSDRREGGDHFAGVKQLLQTEAEVNEPAEGDYGATTLQGASGEGHLAVVERLLEKGADINAEPGEDNGRTALQAASGGGYLAVVERLLDKGADINAAPGEYDGSTALQAASGGGHLAVVERLLKKGADINAAPGEYGGSTALQAASDRGHLVIVERLLEKGADINVAPGRTVEGQPYKQHRVEAIAQAS